MGRRVTRPLDSRSPSSPITAAEELDAGRRGRRSTDPAYGIGFGIKADAEGPAYRVDPKSDIKMVVDDCGAERAFA
jgi:hypothetical protein